MAEQLCDRCGLREAVAVVQQTTPSEPPTVARLCPVCLAENQGATQELRRSGLFDEFFDAFFGPGADPDDEGGAGGRPARGRGADHVDITRLFCQTMRDLLQRAARRAMEQGSLDLDPHHLLWAALQDDAIRRLLAGLDVDAEDLERQLEARFRAEQRMGIAPEVSPGAKYALLGAYQVSRRVGASYIGPEHLLAALAADGETASGQLLSRAGADGEAIEGAIASGAADRSRAEPSTSPTLDQYSRDLTALARDGELDPVIGREDQIDLTIEVLSRRTKNNPVLVGEAGVGKTAVVEGIAQRIVEGDVPDTLAGKRLLNLELGSLLAGTRYRGDFEERLQRIMDEIRADRDQLLVFIDEIHTIVGAGAGEGAMDAANMLKPALARGELHVIGATTLDEYRRAIEKDPALERRFQPVTVPEPSVEDTVAILCGLKDRYEAFHRVRFLDEAIDAAAELSHRYVADRFLPDKAIDLMDQAGARVRLRDKTPSDDGRARREELAELHRDKEHAVASEDYERAAELHRRIDELERSDDGDDGHRRAPAVTGEDIAEVVARATGIPVSQLTLAERERLLELEAHLHARVVDQDEAVTAVAQAVRRSRAGLADPERPDGSFLFLGPTGVGKTELARALAQALFGDEDLMIRLDMSEFQERHTVSRLIGSPPGYVGYEEAGQLTERLRRRPYAVLLLDEIEKAHPDVFNLLLQLLDDGRLTDAHGRTVDCRNIVVIMTSNVGAERLHGAARRVGFGRPTDDDRPDMDRIRDEVMEELRRTFRPEFLNRIDEIVVFRPLGRPQLRQITRLLLDAMVRRMAGRRIGVTLTDDAVDLLARIGFDPEYGARPLRRAIQRELENELSRMVLEEVVEAGDAVAVSVADGQLSFDVRRGGFAELDLREWSGPDAASRPEPAGPRAPRG